MSIRALIRSDSQPPRYEAPIPDDRSDRERESDLLRTEVGDQREIKHECGEKYTPRDCREGCRDDEGSEHRIVASEQRTEPQPDARARLC